MWALVGSGREFTLAGPDGGIVHWKRGQLLGSGSFGKVYAALDFRSGVSIAVKQVSIPTDPTAKKKLKEVTVSSCTLPSVPVVLVASRRYPVAGRVSHRSICFCLAFSCACLMGHAPLSLRVCGY